MNKKTIDFKKASKKVGEKNLYKAILEGKINPLIRDNITGELVRVRVKAICEKTGNAIVERFDDPVI